MCKNITKSIFPIEIIGFKEYNGRDETRGKRTRTCHMSLRAIVRRRKRREETMTDSLLQIQGLKVGVEGKEILHGIHLTIRPGETHVLMGPNGAGKSTLGFALMGSPRHEVTEGSVLFGGRQITHETADKRARQGLFLSFQNPLECAGPDPGKFYPQCPGAAQGVRIGFGNLRRS